jgi:two-component system cell cycle sensor histidine kinase/response regulator CckA
VLAQESAARQIVFAKRWLLLSAFVIFAAILSMIAPARSLAIVFQAASGTVALAVLVNVTAAFVRRRWQRKHRNGAMSTMAEDPNPCIITNDDGMIVAQNNAALATFIRPAQPKISDLFAPLFADPIALIARLAVQATQTGAAKEDITTRDGTMRLSAHRVGGDLLWRLETLWGASDGASGANDHALPMVMVSQANVILFMNAAARALVGKRVTALSQIIGDMPVEVGGMVTVQTAKGPICTTMAEVAASANRRALYFLPHAEERFKDAGWAALQQLPIPLIKVAPGGEVMSFNDPASRLVGADLAEGAALAELMEGLGRSISDWLQDTLEGRLLQKPEFLRLKRSDREVFVQIRLSLISESGTPVLIAVLHDATELKSLEAQFTQSQKMQAIGQLAGGVAHDFNNLLTAISGHCDLLLLRHDPSDRDYSDLVQIDQNANRAAALVGQLLAFSRKQTLRPETVNMRDTLADLTHLLNRLVGETVTLTLSHDPILQSIRADKRQLEQVLMNLIVNARDAMPTGGEITVTTENTHLDEPLTRDRVTVPVGRYVTVQVTDAGEGIAPDRLQKVFEPFYTTKRTGEGTGLGLSTAYGIVKQSGGYIFVDSAVGEGTTFTLYFPCHTQKIEAPKFMKPPISTSGSKRDDGTVLLVEDEAPVRAFASRALRMRGYTVLEADSAEMALKTLEDEALTIDVFVTDVIMPGMDGPTWVREALKARPGVPVVFVSGYAEDSFGDAQMTIPNSVFLPKPFSLTELTNTVNSQIQ